MNKTHSMILGIGKNNIFNTLQIIKKHRPEIEAHLKGQTYEGLNGNGAIISGVPNTVLIIILIISLLIWLWAFYVTIKYFNRIPIISQIFAILGLFGFGGPFLTLLAVYIGINSHNGNYSKSSKFLGKY
jgi:hypothetical protein